MIDEKISKVNISMGFKKWDEFKSKNENKVDFKCKKCREQII